MLLYDTSHINIEFINLNDISSCDERTNLFGDYLSALHNALHRYDLLEHVEVFFF
jgi:hypothetical protein